MDRHQDPDRRHRARLVALLPMIMGVYLLGWLGSELTLRVAVIAGDISPWLERRDRILKIALQRRQPRSFCAQILGQRLSSGVILRIRASMSSLLQRLMASWGVAGA